MRSLPAFFRRSAHLFFISSDKRFARNLRFYAPTPTTVVDIQMTDAHVESVRISADSNATTDPGKPRQTVTLKFDSVVYTFQPYLPNGQKNGPPVTFSAKFKK